MSETNEKIRETVRQEYTKIARGGSCCCGSSSPDKLAEGIGYTGDDLEVLPEGANMGLSCGNPTAIANLKPGQVVLDLGSGGGFDVFIAGQTAGLARDCPRAQTGRQGVHFRPCLEKTRAGKHFEVRRGISRLHRRGGSFR